MATPDSLAAKIASSIGPASKSGPGSILDGGPSGQPGAADGDEGDESGEEAAAEDIMSAMTSNDPKALTTALKSFVEICMNKSY